MWRAWDEVLVRPVALKIMHRHQGQKAARYARRFLREARLAAAIRHANVVEVLDFGVHEGRPYLVMELLNGEPLARRLDRSVQLDVHTAIEIALGVLDGLAAAHRAGVIHRDLTPDNIFLSRDGDVLRPKILDFGVSRSLDTKLRLSPHTPTEGVLLGTPEYMSPEQARGSIEVDSKSDLYSAAVILYESLAGILPYRSEKLGDLIVEIVTETPLPLCRVRPDVGPISNVLVRAMSHRPEDRFESAEVMRDALSNALMRACRGPRRPRRKESPAGSPKARLAGIALIAAGILFAGYWVGISPQPSPARAAVVIHSAQPPRMSSTGSVSRMARSSRAASRQEAQGTERRLAAPSLDD